MSELTNSSPEARAARLRRLRNMANLTRKLLCERYDLKIDTLIGWEVARHGGLTENGAKKILEFFSHEGIHCSLSWLLDGFGIEPSFFQKNNYQSDREKIQEELKLLSQHHSDILILEIKDDAMEPTYCLGDWVAGRIQPLENLLNFIGQVCLIKIPSGEVVLRKLIKSSQNNHYHLLPTNPSTRDASAIILDQNIVQLGVLMWYRRNLD